MSTNFEINIKMVSLEDLEAHSIAFSVISHILRVQSQPVVITAANVNELHFLLRMNLDTKMCERLIFNEIRENLPGYDLKVNIKTREMKVIRRVKAHAHKTAETKPVKHTAKATG